MNMMKVVLNCGCISINYLHKNKYIKKDIPERDDNVRCEEVSERLRKRDYYWLLVER